MGQSENARPSPALVVTSDAPSPLALPESLTWAATLDPHDESCEIEITEEMVRTAIAEMEREQPWPFGGASDRRVERVARPVTRADVIVFPGCRADAG